ncbi:MAG: amidohydrolase family protein [Bryobacteraceae bacterium]|jgi:imidazolonepropionase-like amidohydrolase
MRALAVALALSAVAIAQTAPVNGRRYPRLAIRNAIVVDGNGTPASGPYDIIIDNNRITDVVALDPVALNRGAKRLPAPVEIDAQGKYVLPALINAHAHTHDERDGIPQPLEYELKIWLACGITSVRDVGSKLEQTLALRNRSASGEIVAPRIFVYPMFGRAGGGRVADPKNADEARASVRQVKQMGVDGIKMRQVRRDVMEAIEDEAHKLNLPVAHLGGVEETTALDDIRFGTRSIEHWYGIPEAAIPDGVQNFPPSYNYNDETDRFRYAGQLWREADPKKLQEVLTAMVKANVAWVPTFEIYEASRDLQRAQNQSWFREYLHPALAEYFRPNPGNHGSYFLHWTSNDEVLWKENYRIWMAAVRDFDRLGGLVGVGDDAGFIYQIYGFGLLRELELHEEAGFHPIKVIQHATGNNAKILGMEDQLGGVRPGYLADLIIVNGNPLDDIKVLYPSTEGAGIEWTIKDGIAYHAPTLAAEVRDIVKKAREPKAAPNVSAK